MAEAVAVLGAGSWGTALAIQLARNQLQVRLWGHEADHIARLRELRENSDFLPGFRLADNIEPVASLEDAVKDTPYLLIVIPSKGFRKLKPLIDDDRLLFWASKGFEIETGKLLHEVVTEELALRHYGVVSGPTFATEVARGTIRSPAKPLPRCCAVIIFAHTPAMILSASNSAVRSRTCWR
jgi:glycerol-3-phosphate dehydrogenase (NAD(P)+)